MEYAVNTRGNIILPQLCAMNPLIANPDGNYLLHQTVGAIDVYNLVTRHKVCSLPMDSVNVFGHGKLATFGGSKASVILIASGQLNEYALSNGAPERVWKIPTEITSSTVLSLYCKDNYLIFHTYEQDRLFVYYCEFHGNSLELKDRQSASRPISAPYVEWAPSGRMRLILSGSELNILFWNNQNRYWWSPVLPPFKSLEYLWLHWNPASDWCLFNAAYCPDPGQWPLQRACPRYEIQALALALTHTGVKFVKNPVIQIEKPSALDPFMLALEHFGTEFQITNFSGTQVMEHKDAAHYAYPIPRAKMVCMVSRDGDKIWFFDDLGRPLPF